MFNEMRWHDNSSKGQLKVFSSVVQWTATQLSDARFLILKKFGKTKNFGGLLGTSEMSYASPMNILNTTESSNEKFNSHFKIPKPGDKLF